MASQRKLLWAEPEDSREVRFRMGREGTSPVKWLNLPVQRMSHTHSF